MVFSKVGKIINQTKEKEKRLREPLNNLNIFTSPGLNDAQRYSNSCLLLLYHLANYFDGNSNNRRTLKIKMTKGAFLNNE